MRQLLRAIVEGTSNAQRDIQEAHFYHYHYQHTTIQLDSGSKGRFTAALSCQEAVAKKEGCSFINATKVAIHSCLIWLHQQTSPWKPKKINQLFAGFPCHDAAVICEAVIWPSIRFMPIKGELKMQEARRAKRGRDGRAVHSTQLAEVSSS